MTDNRLVARRRARGWIHGLTRIVALDARSLALMRIGIGGTLLADLCWAAVS
jgi:hypothetical protein